MALASLSRSLLSRMSVSISAAPVAAPEDASFDTVLNRELYPHRKKVVEDGCPEDSEPHPLLSGESVEYLGRSCEDHLVSLSNYRLFATEHDGFYSVPLGLIEGVELTSTKDALTVLCKDARTFKLVFESAAKCKRWQERISQAVKRTTAPALQLKGLFAFTHKAYRKDLRLECGEGGEGGDDDSQLQSLKVNWRDDVMVQEYDRMGMKSVWKITQCNDKHNVCGTYPKLLVVPHSVSDQELAEAAQFRMSGRIPVIVWRHPDNGCVIARSSQPLVGVFGWRNTEDERLLLAISQACHAPSSSSSSSSSTAEKHGSNVTTTAALYHLKNGGTGGDRHSTEEQKEVEEEEEADTLESSSELESDGEGGEGGEGVTLNPKLMVFDLRSYTAALGNRAKGGGCEHQDYYPNCEVHFKGIPNIHSVRKSFQQLRAILTSDDEANFLSSLERTQWLHYLSQLLAVSSEVVGVVHEAALPVLVHCSDGWDRTTQVVALAELMLDPFYRTFEGFKLLVEREWVGYGHKFGERCLSGEASQSSPIFLQWLDCVHQLIRQHPCDFQFNEAYLLKLVQHCYSCLYGSFLGNSMCERDGARVSEETVSVWSLLRQTNHTLRNHLYNPGARKLLQPVTHVRNMLLWRELYCSPLLIPYPPVGTLSLPSSSSSSSPDNPTPSTTAGGQNCGAPLPPHTFLPLERSWSSSPSREELDNGLPNGRPAEPDSPTDKAPPVKFDAPPSTNGTPPALANSFPPVTPPDSDGGDSSDLTQPPMTGAMNSHDNGSSSSSSQPLDSKCLTDSVTIPNGSNSAAWKNHMDTSPLHEAITDVSPHSNTTTATAVRNRPSHRLTTPNHNSTIHSSSSGRQQREVCGLSLDVDGLPRLFDGVQQRLAELERQHRSEVHTLRLKVERAQRAASKATLARRSSSCTDRGGESAVSNGHTEEELADPLSQSPSSLTSWDCVERGDTHGVRWVPDHAASHCQGCGAAFWSLLTRRHHCRNCGGVFCGQCASYFCPVPREQLFRDVRVCERCYYKLDGHLAASRLPGSMLPPS